MKKNTDISRIVGNRNVATSTRPKRKKDSLLLKLKVHIFFLILSLSIFSMLYLYSGFQQTQVGYEISRLKKEEIRLQELNRKLRLEISVLRSPQRLEKIAKERFKLKHPSPKQVIIIKNEGQR